MKTYIVILFFLFQYTILFAQNNNLISGNVIDDSGSPIAYAHIEIKSLSIGVMTDNKGYFELKDIPEGTHKIDASFLGFITETHTIKIQKGQKKELYFSLQKNIEELDDVMIISESEKTKKERTAQAVTVIETKEAKLKTTDLGEVIAQTEGVSIRRSGGLGATAKFSLNGLTGNQIRFFLDGIPLHFNGYTFGISTVPVNLIDRIEVYKGIVPIQFGADALGGTVNIVSPKISVGLSGSASYQTGSFGTHRTAVYIKNRDKNTGLFFTGGGFYDYSKNNYKVDVKVANKEGKLTEVTVPRFHDAYQGYGVNFTIGVKDRPWANELSVKGFYTDYTKEIQHNNLMSGIPYGEVMSFRKSAGTILTYRKNITDNINLDAVFGYNYSERQFEDTSDCVYNWFGECISNRNIPGEINAQLSGSNGASDQYTWNNNFFSRINASWKLKEHHIISATLAPTYTKQTGDDRFVKTFDPLNTRKNLFTWVNGVEYKINAFDKTLENIFFVKNYLQNIKSEEYTPPSNNLAISKRNVSYFGFGNGLNYRFNKQFSTKVTYEYATRLPQPDELFGDGQFILSNLELEPERSHNANLEFTFKNKNNYETSNWKIHTNTFLRKVDNLILFVPSVDRTSIYQNVFEAISIGAELSANWTSKNDRLTFSGNSTYQNFYNNSKEGLFAAFYEDRIPNRPYFFANGSASYNFKNIFQINDKLSLFGNTRYVHKFFRSWESAGLESFKQGIPSQQVYNTGITYDYKMSALKYAITVEVQNLTNEKNFDFYGVQKPGRAFYIKLVTQF
ncbi:TonB-dependent receptor [Aquimarina muelleri]|uniref:TonB-dependent receptor n=1 Tax=Aquimarina muelleri TaxID=279356 RepID=A0A918JY77_9FLAO|nr:TonB-dependent receptor [Aquimarina muelleri]MCX2763243.1 carboxypeptidase-like regulatory domain-containing protein [Aquimarina muelleri]GGX27729.1 TonB-dependent receptor [Aquimarina muelleri]